MRERDAVIVSVTNHRPHFSSVIIAAESRPHLKCSVVDDDDDDRVYAVQSGLGWFGG